jgi:hypothetical protein
MQGEEVSELAHDLTSDTLNRMVSELIKEDKPEHMEMRALFCVLWHTVGRVQESALIRPEALSFCPDLRCLLLNHFYRPKSNVIRDMRLLINRSRFESDIAHSVGQPLKPKVQARNNKLQDYQFIFQHHSFACMIMQSDSSEYMFTYCAQNAAKKHMSAYVNRILSLLAA